MAFNYDWEMPQMAGPIELAMGGLDEGVAEAILADHSLAPSSAFGPDPMLGYELFDGEFALPETWDNEPANFLDSSAPMLAHDNSAAASVTYAPLPAQVNMVAYPAQEAPQPALDNSPAGQRGSDVAMFTALRTWLDGQARQATSEVAYPPQQAEDSMADVEVPNDAESATDLQGLLDGMAVPSNEQDVAPAADQPAPTRINMTAAMASDAAPSTTAATTGQAQKPRSANLLQKDEDAYRKRKGWALRPRPYGPMPGSKPIGMVPGYMARHKAMTRMDCTRGCTNSDGKVEKRAWCDHGRAELSLEKKRLWAEKVRQWHMDKATYAQKVLDFERDGGIMREGDLRV